MLSKEILRLVRVDSRIKKQGTIFSIVPVILSTPVW